MSMTVNDWENLTDDVRELLPEAQGSDRADKAEHIAAMLFHHPQGPTQAQVITVMSAMNEIDPLLIGNEEEWLTHYARFGSDGYPVTKMGREWWLPNFPGPFKTKRAAVEQWERYIMMLLDKKAGRL